MYLLFISSYLYGLQHSGQVKINMMTVGTLDLFLLFNAMPLVFYCHLKCWLFIYFYDIKIIFLLLLIRNSFKNQEMGVHVFLKT